MALKRRSFGEIGCALADFFLFYFFINITDAYERGADGRSADSRTIGDGERDTEEANSWQLEVKGRSDENKLVLFCAVLLLASTSVLRLVKNPDHDRQRHLVKSSLSAGKGRGGEKRRREEERERERKERKKKRQYSVLVKKTKK